MNRLRIAILAFLLVPSIGRAWVAGDLQLDQVNSIAEQAINRVVTAGDFPTKCVIHYKLDSYAKKNDAGIPMIHTYAVLTYKDGGVEQPPVTLFNLERQFDTPKTPFDNILHTEKFFADRACPVEKKVIKSPYSPATIPAPAAAPQPAAPQVPVPETPVAPPTSADVPFHGYGLWHRSAS